MRPPAVGVTCARDARPAPGGVPSADTPPETLTRATRSSTWADDRSLFENVDLVAEGVRRCPALPGDAPAAPPSADASRTDASVRSSRYFCISTSVGIRIAAVVTCHVSVGRATCQRGGPRVTKGGEEGRL